MDKCGEITIRVKVVEGEKDPKIIGIFSNYEHK